MDRPKLDIEKIKTELPTANDYLAEKYGKHGTPEREAFSAKAIAYYYGELIKETRKEQKLTQQELAEKIGKERAYIAKIEQGKTDLQISNFVQIINALGLSLKVGWKYQTSNILNLIAENVRETMERIVKYQKLIFNQ